MNEEDKILALFYISQMNNRTAYISFLTACAQREENMGQWQGDWNIPILEVQRLYIEAECNAKKAMNIQ